MAEKSICSISGCDKLAKSKGFCENHYRRFLRYGSPTGGARARGEVRKFFLDNVLTYKGDDCLIWPYAKGTTGYALMQLGGRCQTVSRVVCLEVNGPPPAPEYESAHSCGNGHLACVTPSHVAWKTPKDNCADRVTHGTMLRGERHGMAVLSTDDVIEIRTLAGSASCASIGKSFGVNSGTIHNIIKRRTWAHIAPPAD